jgi:hypothetical protein
MVFAFSTHAILGGDCAARVIASLPPMDDDIRFCVRVCLHEALYNAALHGNLELKDIHHSGIVHQVQERLQDPVLGSRCVFVDHNRDADGLEMTVRDCGDHLFSWPTEDLPHRIHGLKLIRQLTHQVTFDATIKTLTMRFCWKEGTS